MRTLLVVAALLLSSRTARADDWYGEQIIAVDGAAFALETAGVIHHREDSFSIHAEAIWLSTYVFGPAIVHTLHHQRGRAGASIAARAVVPLATGLAAHGLGLDDPAFSITIVLSMIAVAAVDAGLARTSDPAEPRMLSFGGAF